MGYQTYYTLSLDPQNEKKLAEIIETEELLDIFDHEGNATDWYKWYEYRSDMITVSRRHPDLIFCLRGEGEDREDNWMEYYHDGKFKHLQPELRWPSFEDVEWEVPPDEESSQEI